jgi:hypothetical protein
MQKKSLPQQKAFFEIDIQKCLWFIERALFVCFEVS